MKIEIFRAGRTLEDHSTVAHENTFYIFGGFSLLIPQGLTPVKTIAAFNTVDKKWKKVGELSVPRRNNAVIFREGEFIVVGGTRYVDLKSDLEKPIRTERCTFSGESIHCQLVDPEFKGSLFTPHLMTVPNNYCLE